jgi:hypothetical protein
VAEYVVSDARTGRRVKMSRMVNVEFVGAEFFVNRIREFEKKYNQPWLSFLAKYKAGGISDKPCNPDFVEWAFLCNSFLPELMSEFVKADDESPPANEPVLECEKPELNSGFSLLWRQFVRSGSIFGTSTRGSCYGQRSLHSSRNCGKGNR